MNVKYIVILLIFGLFSCSTKEYLFVLQNETKFNLDTVEFDFCGKGNILTLPLNSISDTFELDYNESGWNFFGKGGLCMSVNSYSDSLRTYSNIYGEVLDRKLLRGFNSVKIKVDTSNSSNTFNFIFK